MLPMIPGRAAAALPANLARSRPRLFRCFLTHSRRPPLSDGAGGGDGGVTVPPPPPVNARTSVLIAIPIAVRMLTRVTPCSRKRVRTRSASVLSPSRTRVMVSRIRDSWPRSSSLMMLAASSLASLSSSLSANSRSRAVILFWISCWRPSSSVSVSFVRSRAMWSLIPGISSSSSLSFARLFTSSSCFRVIASLSPRSSLFACPTHWTSSGGSSMVANAAVCSEVSSSSRAVVAISAPAMASWTTLLSSSGGCFLPQRGGNQRLVEGLSRRSRWVSSVSVTNWRNLDPRGSPLSRRGWLMWRGQEGVLTFCWWDQGWGKPLAEFAHQPAQIFRGLCQGMV